MTMIWALEISRENVFKKISEKLSKAERTFFEKKNHFFRVHIEIEEESSSEFAFEAFAMSMTTEQMQIYGAEEVTAAMTIFLSSREENMKSNWKLTLNEMTRNSKVYLNIKMKQIRAENVNRIWFCLFFLCSSFWIPLKKI